MLRVRGLSKSYGRTAALTDFSASLSPGKIYGLLGPNGSGKSTCLHALTGLLPADSGSVLLRGIDIADPASRRHLGFAPDDLPLPGALTGTEYLRVHDALRGRQDLDGAWTLVESFELGGDLTKLLDEYSHGMRRKIQLVAATMHAPALLVLDEPFRGLDPQAVVMLRHVIRALAAAGSAVLIATHDMRLAAGECDQIMLLAAGEVVASGAPDEVVATTDGATDLESAFLIRSGAERATRERAQAIAVLFAVDTR